MKALPLGLHGLAPEKVLGMLVAYSFLNRGGAWDVGVLGRKRDVGWVGRCSGVGSHKVLAEQGQVGVPLLGALCWWRGLEALLVEQ